MYQGADVVICGAGIAGIATAYFLAKTQGVTEIVHDGGYYTQTKENLPLIGPLGVEGAYMVGALSGYGTMAVCAAGELGAAWIAGSELPDYAQQFSMARYDDPAYVASLDNIGSAGEL